MTIGLADVTPMVHGFNTSAPPPPSSIDQDSIDGDSDREKASTTSESSTVRLAISSLLLLAVPAASLL